MLVRGRTGETVAIVTDFGLTKAIENDSSLFESGREQNAGAPYFMAPESLRHGKASRESDIYSFGLVADEMVTRTRAFPTRSLPELIYAKVWGAAIAPKDRAENLPPRWNQAILRAIHKEPAKRYPTALEFVGALADRVANADEPPNWTRRLAIAAAFSGGGYLVYRGSQSLESSVEVFDFENQSADTGQDYFCRGTGLELMRRLMHVDGLRVVPRHATRVKSTAPSKTRFSLDGALQAHEGRIRLSVFLTDNQNGQLVWSQAFDRRQISNPLSLQLDLANGAADALEQHLTSEDDKDVLATIIRGSRRWLGMRFQSRLASAPTADGVAFDLYMRGSKLLEEYSPSSISAAIEHFQKAVERDPNFALAWAASADAHLNQGVYSNAPGTDPFVEARLRAETAVRTQPELVEAHLSLAAVRQAEWNWTEAESEYKRVLKIRPLMARANRWYAGFVIQFGRVEEGLRFADLALELDPYDRGTPVTVGLCRIIARRYLDAIRLLGAPQLSDYASVQFNLAQAHALYAESVSPTDASKHFNLALRAAARCAELDRTPKELQVAGDEVHGIVFALMKNAAELDLRLARLESAYRARRISGIWLAYIYALMGRREDALSVLETALRERDTGLKYIKVIPFLASLHSEPRFHAIVRTMKL